MGGVPAAMGAAGNAIGGAAKSFWGSAKQGVQDNYVQPWKNAVSDMHGNAPPLEDPNAPPSAPGAAPTPRNTAMSNFFNSPATETPAMRLRRMYQQQA